MIAWQRLHARCMEALPLFQTQFAQVERLAGLKHWSRRLELFVAACPRQQVGHAGRNKLDMKPALIVGFEIFQ